MTQDQLLNYNTSNYAHTDTQTQSQHIVHVNLLCYHMTLLLSVMSLFVHRQTCWLLEVDTQQHHELLKPYSKR